MMKIEITADNGSMRETLDEALATLGYIRQPERAVIGEAMSGTSLSSHDKDDVFEGVSQTTLDRLEKETDEGIAFTKANPEIVQGEQPKRERGKPRPGQLRRNSVEKAEDDAADAADAATGSGAQISTRPENRVGPEDSAEVQAQDAADEKEESDALKGGLLTLDDVREAVGLYYTKYGMGPATADIQAIFGCKLHEIPDNQDAYAKAVQAVQAAVEDNPYGRTPIGGDTKIPDTKKSTLDDLKVVMGRYIKSYGEKEGYDDLPKVLGIDSVGNLPADPTIYAEKIKLVEQAIADNPFGRKSLS